MNPTKLDPPLHQPLPTTPDGAANAMESTLPLEPADAFSRAASTVGPAPAATTHLGEALPDVPGHAISGVIGQGGMGAVYQGRDLALGRDTAIKVMLDRAKSRPDLVERFVEEAQIGGRLQHPGIVPVHLLGTLPSGLPFFTMKLVKGRTLADLLAQRENAPRFLKIFEQLAQAMAYAHAQGIIHRDLKPGNIMVGEFGELQVMDWGLAKQMSRERQRREEATTPVLSASLNPSDPAATADFDAGPPATADAERQGRTQAGQILGTPAYMAPEQARGEVHAIDARADVFALGAILCEMLTGRPPYDGISAATILERARAGAVGSALARLDASGADADVSALAKACLAPDREKRPDDAGVVAARISAHLVGVQERLRQAEISQAAAEAKAAEAQARVAAERRARQWAFGVAAVTLLGLGIASGLAAWALRAEGEAVFQKEVAQKKEKEAKESEEISQASLDFVEFKVFAAARPKDYAGGLGHDVKLADALRASLPFVESSFKDKPLIEARLRMTLASSFSFLDDPKTAAEQEAAACRLYARVRGADHPDTLRSMNNLANSYGDLGRHAEALQLYEKTLALLKAKLGADHPDVLAAMNNLALCCQDAGRPADAVKLHEETLKRWRAQLGHDHPRTLLGSGNLANAYAALGRHDDALKLREATLPLQQAKLGADHPDTLKTMKGLAQSYASLGRSEEALKLREAQLPLLKAKLGPDHRDTLEGMSALASSYKAAGRHAEAIELQEAALAARRARLGPGHPDTLHSMNNLSASYAAVGRHADALKLSEETLALTKATFGPDHPITLLRMGNLAVSLSKADRGAEAVPLIDECVRRSAGKEVHPRLLPMVADLRLRHFEKAKDAAGCRQTAEMWEKLKRADAGSCYVAACQRAVTATAVLADAKTPSADAARLAEEESNRAMAWLRQAIAAGYSDAEGMKKDKDLEALRGRKDFQEMLASLSAAASEEKK